MPDYQVAPSQLPQFGDPLDFSGLDPSVLLPARKLAQVETGVNVLAMLQAQQAAAAAALRQQQMATDASLQNSRDITAGQGVINAIHPDVHDALIAAERRGGGAHAVLGGWSQSADLFK